MVLVQQPGQYVADCGSRQMFVAKLLLRLKAEANRLAKKCMRILLARKFQHGPGPPGKHDAMHVYIVLDGILQLIEGSRGLLVGYGGESRLGVGPIDCSNCVTQCLITATAGWLRRFNRMQGILVVSL